MAFPSGRLSAWRQDVVEQLPLHRRRDEHAYAVLPFRLDRLHARVVDEEWIHAWPAPGAMGVRGMRLLDVATIEDASRHFVDDLERIVRPRLDAMSNLGDTLGSERR